MSTSDDMKRLQRRIAALLAKAEGTNNEAEAEAFTEHAEKLMLQHGLDRAIIAARRSVGTAEPERIVHRYMEFKGTYNRALMVMCHQLTELFQVKSYFFRHRSSSTLKLIGYESDVAQLEILLTSLQLQVASSLTKWWKKFAAESYEFPYYTPTDRYNARRSFIEGFGNGVYERVMRNRQRGIQEAGSGAELAVVDRLQKVEESLGDMKIRAVKTRRSLSDYDSQQAGYESGLVANTGEDELTKSVTRELR